MSDTPVQVPYPPTQELLLRLATEACRVEIRPGEGTDWVTGVCHDPTEYRPPEITLDGGTVRISQQRLKRQMRLSSLLYDTHYQLALGRSRPFALIVETSVSEFSMDLGGLPITRLEICQDAGALNVDFSAPNPEPMAVLRVVSKASGGKLSHLANANAAELRASSEAAGLALDFGGMLRRDMNVRVKTQVSGVNLVIPGTVPARVTVASGLGGVDAGGFVKQKGIYWTPAGLSGAKPLLAIHVESALAGVVLRTG